VTARADFISAVGPRLLHCTAQTNLEGIRAFGLLPAAALARLAGQDPCDLVLRAQRSVLRLNDGKSAQLNHQLPILRGRAAADRIVEGYSAAAWAAQLDRRVFFWPERAGRRFVESVARDSAVALIWVPSGVLFDLVAGALDLSPINSGNFRQGGAQAARGDWLDVPATAGRAAFRENRMRRGLKATPDKVCEVSLPGGLSRVAWQRLWPDINWYET